ncbi:MAG: DUF3365 domain-containing protein [Paludisphaera borealis]|uniref:c-type heme family protein n=1 Tax=Paludisphaera borealis TaxID=1387353 RepID=UPI00283B2104|nr:DUF3365 domain-containing protein [Paludisphaera borealis]MDR3618893.1 DUF3365 domain-containing protein [Paludisphaera borealis]
MFRMYRLKSSVCVVRTIIAGLALTIFSSGATPPDEPSATAAAAPRPSAGEARERAKLLHGTIHDTLQIVHSRYYREDEGLPIPAATLKLVFQRLAERDGVELHWLAVDTKAMNIDHAPRNEFEKEAVKVLVSGKEEYDLAGDGVYRRVGLITLGSECLECHLPGRTSNKSRTAGLVITMPIMKK